MASPIKVTGLGELQRALFTFNAKLGTRVTQLALKTGARYMQTAIKNKAPTGKTGRLKKSVRVRVSKLQKIQKTGSVGVYIIVGGGARKNLRGAYYAKWVNYGYNSGSEVITGSQAVGRRLITQTDYQNRRLNALQRALSRRRPGRSIVVGGVRLRDGGKAIPGQHFVEKAFTANAQSTLDLIVAASEKTLTAIANEVNLKVK